MPICSSETQLPADYYGIIVTQVYSTSCLPGGPILGNFHGAFILGCSIEKPNTWVE